MNFFFIRCWCNCDIFLWWRLFICCLFSHFLSLILFFLWRNCLSLFLLIFVLLQCLFCIVINFCSTRLFRLRLWAWLRLLIFVNDIGHQLSKVKIMLIILINCFLIWFFCSNESLKVFFLILNGSDYLILWRHAKEQ